MFTLRVLCIVLICVLTAGMAAPALATDCITGTVTAVETSPGSGLWKYCVSFTYDVTALANSPSHFSLLVGALAECPCVCETGSSRSTRPRARRPGRATWDRARSSTTASSRAAATPPCPVIRARR